MHVVQPGFLNLCGICLVYCLSRAPKVRLASWLRETLICRWVLAMGLCRFCRPSTMIPSRSHTSAQVTIYVCMYRSERAPWMHLYHSKLLPQGFPVNFSEASFWRIQVACCVLFHSHRCSLEKLQPWAVLLWQAQNDCICHCNAGRLKLVGVTSGTQPNCADALSENSAQTLYRAS